MKSFAGSVSMLQPYWSLLLKTMCFLLCGMLLVMAKAQAYCVYNQTSQTISVHTVDSGNTLRTHTLGPHNDDGGSDFACAHYADHLGLPQTQIVSMWATTPNWICILAMQAGGYAHIRERSRAALASWPNGFSSPPNDLYCVSHDHDNTLRDDSRPTGYDGRSLAPADRDIRFLVSADPQYWNDPSAEASAMNASADAVMASMVNIIHTTDARGILLAGDLTQDSDAAEEQMYVDATAGIRRFFFDGIGNHHPNDASDLRLSVIQRNTVLTSRWGPHYAWDWQDVHFVQLNIFPGNGIDDDAVDDIDPDNSLAYLMADLALYVGDSGRPVILIHHYGFDGFSTNPIAGTDPIKRWWTEAQRTDYLEAIANYNVIAMFTGHTHLDQTDGVDAWALNVPNCGTSGSCKDFVAGAARGRQSGTGLGVFLDVEINGCNAMIVTRKDKTGNAIPGQQVTVSFAAPGSVNPACDPQPIATAE